MEQIETQATDLRYLAQAPVLLSADASPIYEQQTSPGSASIGDNSAPARNLSVVSVATSGPGGSSSLHGPGSSGTVVAGVGAVAGSAGGANKRKSATQSLDDAGSGAVTKQTRSKRNRYISIACNECKRRKIKCNGENPCTRCGNLNLACLYAANCCSGNFKDSEEFKHVTAQISRLQNEVNWLSQALKSLQGEPGRMLTTQISTQDQSSVIAPLSAASTPAQTSSSVPTQRSDQVLANHASFRGPTSMAYTLDVANTTIANMGYKTIGDTTGSGNDQQDQQLSDSADMLPVEDRLGVYDPLLDYDEDEMTRLCRLYEEEVGIMYPVLDIQTVITHARNLAAVLDPVRGQRPLEPLNDQKSTELKMIMCCALVVEEHGHSDQAVRLYNSMEAVVNRKLMADASDSANLPLLCLLAGYRFLSNDEVLAWRVMGQVTRLCLELGIHRRSGLMKLQTDQERQNALNNFWSAYVLDRRWAFGTGLPFVIQDDEIDPHLPLPEQYPYLLAMISYSRLCARVWRQITYFGPVLARELHQEEIDRLDQEILQWYESIPDEVKVRNWSKERHMNSTSSYNLQRLRIWTYLRFNQARIWLYTPVLHSATSIMQNLSQAQMAVDLAKDTIRYLSHMNATTNLYRKIQVFYHQFLSSAISVVFLASVHAPIRFSPICRDEFYMALELVRDLSAKSWVSQRLWRTIRSLKDVAPRFGLNPDDDPHSTAALGMIGLATGHMDATANSHSQSPFGRHQLQQQQGSTPVDRNGTLIQNEMSRIFEGYVGLNGMSIVEEGDGGLSGSDLHSPVSGNVYGTDGTVFAQLREMF